MVLKSCVEVQNPKSKSIRDRFKDWRLTVTRDDVEGWCGDIVDNMVDNSMRMMKKVTLFRFCYCCTNKCVQFQDNMQEKLGKHHGWWLSCPVRVILTGGPANMPLVIRKYKEAFSVSFLYIYSPAPFVNFHTG